MEYYKHYLLGRRFVAWTDHQALRWLYSLREPKDRIARWLETLSAYQFSIEHHGHKHVNADAMSRRCLDPQECKCPLLEEEVLKCGPCQKCCQRAVTMDSALMDTQRNQRSMQAQCSDPVHMVQTCSQTKGLQACDLEENATAMAAKGRDRTKYGRMGHQRGNPRKKLPLEEAKGFHGLRQAPKHHPAILTSQMQSQHPLQISCGHYPTQCRI